MITTTEGGRSSQLNATKKIEHYGEEENIIENELLKIDKNLNTFTVDNFNKLRDMIQTTGFNDAAQVAKKDYNLVTESNSTIMSLKDEEITITEESKQRG